MNEELNSFGELSRKFRIKCEKRLIDQSDYLGFPLSIISEFETGEKIVSSQYVQKFADWLNLDFRDRADLVKASSGKSNIVSLKMEKSRRKESQKLFRRVHKLSLTEIKQLPHKRKEVLYEH